VPLKRPLLQKPRGITSHKIPIFIVTEEKIADLTNWETTLISRTAKGSQNYFKTEPPAMRTTCRRILRVSVGNTQMHDPDTGAAI
jgi:hypothetical protein